MLWQHPVHPALTGLVERIVGYDDRPDPASVHHGLPGPATTVILSFDEPLDVLGWSRRHLTARFTAEFGLPPREVARLHRFAAALRLARSRTP